MTENISHVVGQSETQKAVATMANQKKYRVFLAAWLTGAMNAATAFGAGGGDNGKFDKNGRLDLGKFLNDNAEKAGSSLYNDFLDSNSQPFANFWPEGLGFYVGSFGIPTEEIETIIRENGALTIQRGQDTLIDHLPLSMLPSAVEPDVKVATALSGERVYSRGSPQGMRAGIYQLPKGMIWPQGKPMNFYLDVDQTALAYLRAIGTAIPANRKALLALEAYGVLEKKVNVDF